MSSTVVCGTPLSFESLYFVMLFSANIVLSSIKATTPSDINISEYRCIAKCSDWKVVKNADISAFSLEISVK